MGTLFQWSCFEWSNKGVAFLSCLGRTKEAERYCGLSLSLSFQDGRRRCMMKKLKSTSCACKVDLGEMAQPAEVDPLLEVGISGF